MALLCVHDSDSTAFDLITADLLLAPCSCGITSPATRNCIVIILVQALPPLVGEMYDVPERGIQRLLCVLVKC